MAHPTSIVFTSLFMLTAGNQLAETGLQLTDFDSAVGPSTYANYVYAELRAACPSGIEKCECSNAPGKFTTGPFNPEENFLALLTYIGCSPGYCFCKDNPEQEVDVRPDIYKNTLDLCPRNEINRCLCEDSKTTKSAPFDLFTILSCRPTKCKCNGEETAKINTGFGCRKGGWLDCPKPSKLFCNDGTLLDNSYIMKWRTKTADERRRLGDNFEGCICSDGMMPRCGGTGLAGKPQQCPNGDDVDWTLGGAQEFNGCKDPVA